MLHTCSHVGNNDLREAKALLELASVVFCESMVLTKPSRTVSGGSMVSLVCCDLRYLASSGGMPWRDKRVSRISRHSCGVGALCEGNGFFGFSVLI